MKPVELNSIYNPKEGILVTANNNMQKAGGVVTVTLNMGNYRSDRITDMLNV